MSFFEDVGNYVKEDFERRVKDVENMAKTNIHRMEDAQFKRLYDTRYQNEKLLNHPNVMRYVEKEAIRRKIR